MWSDQVFLHGHAKGIFLQTPGNYLFYMILILHGTRLNLNTLLHGSEFYIDMWNEIASTNRHLTLQTTLVKIVSQNISLQVISIIRKKDFIVHQG